MLTKVTQLAAFSALLEAEAELEKVSPCSVLWLNQVALGLSQVAALKANDGSSTRYMTGPPTSTVWTVFKKILWGHITSFLVGGCQESSVELTPERTVLSPGLCLGCSLKQSLSWAYPPSP